MRKINLTSALTTRRKLHTEIRQYLGSMTPNENDAHVAPIVSNLNVAMSKISVAIKVAEGRSRKRTITPDDILSAIEAVETVWKLPKRLLHGIKIDVDINAQNFPRAYTWPAKSTHFTAECRHGRWFLTDIRRAPCRRYGHNIIAQIPDAALVYIANRAVRQAQDIRI